MPGVPSSRGCDECRKSKKKCDLIKPTCSRCKRLRIDCVGGGQLRFKFVYHESSSDSPASSSTPLPLQQRTLVQPLPPDHGPDEELGTAPDEAAETVSAIFALTSKVAHLGESHDKQLSAVRSFQSRRQRQRQHLQELRQKFLQQQQLRHGGIDLMYSGILSRSAEDTRLIGLFWEFYLPNSRLSPGDTLTFGGLLSAIDDPSHNDNGFRDSLLALGLTTVGKRTEDQSMVRAGFHVYSDALQHVSKSITAKKQSLTGQVIASRLFGLYEALFGTELQAHATRCRNWLLHITGEAAMIMAKPPHAYIRGWNHSLFVSGRHHIVFAAFLLKKRTFLCKPIWKTVPWLEHIKSPLDHLLDIIVDVPSVIEGIEAMMAWDNSEKKEAYRKILRRATYNISDRLLSWHGRFGRAVLPHDLLEELPKFLTLDDVTATHTMTLYWSICIRMVSIHLALHQPGEHLEHRIDAEDYCRNLVRAIRLFVHPAMGMFRIHIATFPLSTAIQYLDSMPESVMIPERESLGKVLEDPECFMVREFVTSMDPMQSASLTLFDEVVNQGNDYMII